jgi:predicted enzyme related to lactoylglutathione lyase
MKRFHVHVTVDDLAQSVRFYSTLFATEPTVDADGSKAIAPAAIRRARCIR